MINSTVRFALVIVLCACLPSCGKRPRAYSGGFAEGGMYARFDSSTPSDPVYIIYARDEPRKLPFLHGTMGGDIYGGGYFKFDKGPTIQFRMPTTNTVTIGSHTARLEDGRFIRISILPDESLRFTQEPLDTPLAQTIIKAN